MEEQIQVSRALEEGGLKLNLGCGTHALHGYINVDRLALPGVNRVWNLENTPLPFESDCAVEIVCDHVLEHIINFVPLMEDLHRICRNGAVVKIFVPYYKYEGAFRDPTHVRFFTEHSFEYFAEGHEYSFYSPARFRTRRVELRVTSKSRIKNLAKKLMPWIPFKKLLNPFLWNLYSEVYFELEAVKSGSENE
jgi:SAM-dependent methyltransferase